MNKIQIEVSGKPALVKSQHAKFFHRKTQLVLRALELNRQLKSDPQNIVLSDEIRSTMSQIIRLNRTMQRQAVYCEFV
jgi:hypothetical protein